MATGLKPYPEYKDSGVPWLGQVPEQWRVDRPKWLFQKMDRPVRENDNIVTCFRDGTVTLRKNRRTSGFTTALKEIGYQGIRRGDLVIHAMDAFAGAVGVSDSDGKGSPVYSVCEALPKANAGYYAYIIREMARSQWILALATGIRERSTDFRYGDFACQSVPVPPLSEQVAIVRYLNHADRKVRRAIRTRQQLIKLLTEQKQAIINRAVTRGLDPNVRLKPSGVPWLGDIPEHWEVRRLKSLLGTRITDGPHVTPTFVSDGVPFLSVDGIQNGDLVFETCRYVSPEDHAEFRKKTSPHRDDILLGKAASTGKIARVKVDFEFSIWSPLALIRPDQFQVVSPFLEYALKDFSSQAQIETLCTLNTQKNISMDDIPRVLLPLSPIAEQLAIVHHIEDATTNLDLAIDAARREIDLLREYRTRLIADVVTGKLDVRDVLVPVDKTDVMPEELVSIDDVEATDESDDVAETDPGSEENA